MLMSAVLQQAITPDAKSIMIAWEYTTKSVQKIISTTNANKKTIRY